MSAREHRTAAGITPRPTIVLGRQPESPLTYTELILIGVALGSHATSLRCASLGNIEALERRATQYEAIYDRVARMAAEALDHADLATAQAEIYPTGDR